MQKSRYIHWAQYAYIIGLVASLVLIVPTSAFPFQLGKLLFFLVPLTAAALFFVLGGGVQKVMVGGGLRAALATAALPLAYVISYVFSADRMIGFSGYALEGDTVMFAGISFVTFMLAFALFRTASAAKTLLRGTFITALVAAVFQLVVVAFGTSVIAYQPFADRSVNLVGKWNDLGLLVGLIAILLLVIVEFADLTRMRRRAVYAGLAGTALLLAVVQFTLVWAMLFVFCLALSFWSLVSKRDGDRFWPRSLAAAPWVPLCGVVLTGLFLMWGSVFNTSLTKVFPVSSLEVRPSFTSTLDIVSASHANSLSRFFVGTGPQTFSQAWLMFKPVSVNQSQFWNLDFAVGFSNFVTTLGTIGLLGALAWLIPLILVLFSVARALRSSLFSVSERILAFSLGLGSVYLWCGFLLYVPSQNLILLALALSGATVGFCLRTQHEGEVSLGGVKSFAMGATILALVVLVLGSTVVVARRTVAEVYTNQGLIALSAGDADGALAAANRAVGIEQSNNALRLEVDAAVAKLTTIASTNKNPTAADQAAFAALAQKTIPVAQQLITQSPGDYRSYLSLARVYDLLASLGVSGAYESAKQVYSNAAAHNPTNPQIPLLLARLESAHGNMQGATNYLTQSLTLKQDYTDAILLLVQLNVANKDIPSAILAAQAAVRSAPGVSAIWFQLGLLYYTAGDMDNAIAVLEQTLKIEPGYANAKYFLGLAYAAKGRTPDAIAQFDALQKTNPDNAEVNMILGNLRSGKTPFAGAQSAAATPQTRTTAPVTQ